jgi:Spy/CpxP family protein refolding chaperone
MKSLRFRLLLATITVLLGTAIARSQDAEAAPPPMPPHAFGMRSPEMGFFAHELNLTDDQKTQMKAVMQKALPAMKPLFQQSHQIDVQLRQYVEGNYNETKVRALAVQKAQVETEMTVQHTRIHNQMYQLLTADQQTKLKQIEAEHEARMQQHMQDDPPPPAEE